LKAIFFRQKSAKMLLKPFLQFQIHIGMPQKTLIFKVILTEVRSRRGSGQTSAGRLGIVVSHLSAEKRGNDGAQSAQ
jgi:hypothetical protein